MESLALIASLGVLGFVLAKNHPVKQEQFFNSSPEAEKHHDNVTLSQDRTGHSNEVPFFGARVTQSMYSGAVEGILDNHTGAGKEYFQKRETLSFYDTKPGTGNPFGQQSETEFEQSRMVSGMNMKNVFPIQQTLVGAPGANDGYTNIGQGGFQQDQLREWALPPTTDETRVASKPKLSYKLVPIPGTNAVTQPGIQAPVNKNKPDKFSVLGMDRVNTAVGAQTAPMLYPEQPIKPQARETTEGEYFGSGGGQEGHWASYIRSFTEPFQEFMKLTAEGRPGPAGAIGTGTSIGADQYSVQTRKDETLLSDAMRFMVPTSITTPGGAQLGSFKFNEPLKEDVYVERNSPEIVAAYKNNPYTQSLSSY